MLEQQLETFFGHTNFRQGQKEIITDILSGKDVLGILPTGSGKSICYQLPARILEGTTLVISPLISLMIDQVKQLIASGFKEVIAINSFLANSDRKQVFHDLSKYKLIYASPEMLQNNVFMEKLKKLTVSLFVIDEAHCISQWGHEFRPDYLKLNETINYLNHPPVLALSATATPEVQEDIVHQLDCPLMTRHIYSMDRDNIAFIVERFDHFNQKLEYAANLLKRFPVPTMIYFSSRNWTEQAVDILSKKLPNLRIAFYHGGMDQTDRMLVQQQFMNDQLDVICCTSAFGMGINKTNIRLVIHFHLPTQMESFIQEVGRAGRDGESSVSVVLVAPNDNQLPKRLIETELPTEAQSKNVISFITEHIHIQNNFRLVDTEMMKLFHLSETQWRFLKYQLEKHGMIKEGRILTDFHNPHHIESHITTLIKNRMQYKQEKLGALFEWVAGESCRRKNLFLSFQTDVNKPKYMCCDHCDFTFNQWNPTFNTIKNENIGWKKQLKQLFLQGINNEE
ncbi:RecQ family ATP-dependent DNA helicase [Aquibacillus kalidii]|uniref:RecQ family ATP-dependent DNA helicase n=1 Tax=Aquibacillus kalidii TaxID=2762597 RepID=UPI001647DFAC|nr:ATP-dependent DNA helicase RecQ [Aquibacillus kalidii]